MNVQRNGAKRRRVLLVDDDLMIRDMVKTALEEEGYVVDLAEDSRQALLMIEENQPDLVLLDIFLPGMDGQEAVISWRRHPQAHSVPIVVISSAPDASRRAARMNAKAFLRKPFDIATLIDTVAQYTTDADAA